MAVTLSFERCGEFGLVPKPARLSVLKELRQRQLGAPPQDWISSGLGILALVIFDVAKESISYLSLERGSARPLGSSSDKSF